MSICPVLTLVNCPPKWTFLVSFRGGTAAFTPNRFERSSPFSITWPPTGPPPAHRAVGINLFFFLNKCFNDLNNPISVE